MTSNRTTPEDERFAHLIHMGLNSLEFSTPPREFKGGTGHWEATVKGLRAACDEMLQEFASTKFELQRAVRYDETWREAGILAPDRTPPEDLSLYKLARLVRGKVEQLEHEITGGNPSPEKETEDA